MANSSRLKRDIDKAKKERAAEKRERRARAGATDENVTTDATPSRSPSSNDEVLARLEQIHAQFAADELDFEQFEDAKAALLAQLATD